MSKQTDWTESNLPDLSGETVVITGANSGIGLEATRMLSAAGAHVVLACRNEEKATQAIEEVRPEQPDASLEFMALDLADLESISSFAKTLSEKHEKIDRLINNAGLMALPFRETTDGFEMQFGVNHLGHFALTNQLLPLLEKADDPRVVTVSSNMHMMGKIDFDNLNGERSYSKWGAYGQSKLANLLFTYELQRKLEAAGKSIDSTACHPGYASTNLQTKGPEMEGASLMKRINEFANRVVAQDAHSGALPTVRAAYDSSVSGGQYVGPDGFAAMKGAPVVQGSNKRSHDEATAARLWQVSEELTGVSFPF